MYRPGLTKHTYQKTNHIWYLTYDKKKKRTIFGPLLTIKRKNEPFMAHKSNKLFSFYDLTMILKCPYMARFMAIKFPSFFSFYGEADNVWVAFTVRFTVFKIPYLVRFMFVSVSAVFLARIYSHNPGREKYAKKCKISGEKLVFSPQISYLILR